MVERDLVEAKLAELAHRLDRVIEHRTASATLLAANEDALDLVSFNLLVAVQLCLDVAAHIIADENLPSAKSSAAAFKRLAEHGIVAPAASERLIRATGFRNVVAHAYGKLEPALAYLAATDGVEDLRNFAQAIAVYLQRRR